MEDLIYRIHCSHPSLCVKEIKSLLDFFENWWCQEHYKTTPDKEKFLKDTALLLCREPVNEIRDWMNEMGLVDGGQG